MLNNVVAKHAKSFGWLGLAESLGDFRYDITRKLDAGSPLGVCDNGRYRIDSQADVLSNGDVTSTRDYTKNSTTVATS